MSDELLSGDEIRAMAGLEDWRAMYGALEARYRTGNFAAGLTFVNRVGVAAEEANHHPDLRLSYSYVHVLLTSHDVGGKTLRDVELARRISGIASELGLAAEPRAVQRLELGLDTWAIDEVKPFWQSVLAMTDSGADELSDAEGDNPTIWFQEATAATEQRWHLDLRVPAEVAEERIAAALAAGGTIVSDAEAPRFTVLADPQGNKVCICTHVTRND